MLLKLRNWHSTCLDPLFTGKVHVFIWRACIWRYEDENFRPLKISRTGQIIREHSRSSRNILEYCQMFGNSQEHSRTRSNVEESSRTFVAFFFVWMGPHIGVQWVDKNKQQIMKCEEVKWYINCIYIENKVNTFIKINLFKVYLMHLLKKVDLSIFYTMS